MRNKGGINDKGDSNEYRKKGVRKKRGTSTMIDTMREMRRGTATMIVRHPYALGGRRGAIMGTVFGSISSVK